MERKGTRLSDMLRKRRMPGNLLRFRDQVQARGGQRGHVQRLANVASGLRTIRVVVEKCAASGKVQQRNAAHNRQRPPCATTPEDKSLQVHTPTPRVYHLRRTHPPVGCSRSKPRRAARP